ncbi:MAG: class I poly(R)-hydroxyalkanoic acid synthase [Azospirillum brasilense]|nr:MAG: class I poly(R)-hydroxyalkanoic acid synthase [Azospirillum brasilense]
MSTSKRTAKPRPAAAAKKPEAPAPQDTIDAQLFAENIAKAGELWHRVMQGIASSKLAQPGSIGHTDPLSFTESLMHTLRHMHVDTGQLAHSQLGLMNDHLKLWQSMTQKLLGKSTDAYIEPAPKDRRFKDDAWANHPLFDYLKQGYLINARFMQQSLGAIQGLDSHTAHKLSFFTRQLVDAMAPSNFLATNPEAMRTLLESNGGTLVRGLEQLAKDVERGRISMTDESAFELGRDIAATPGSVVYENDLMQLIQYEATTDKVHEVPLLLVPAWINKYYVLDLKPESSLVKWLTEQGYTVFAISWVNPDEKLGRKSFEDYLREGPLSALDVIERITGSKKTGMMGYCLGGTLTAITLAYLRATGEAQRVASATYLTTLVDFTDAGDLRVFIDDTQLDALEARMSERGYLDGSEMATTFNMLRANDLIWSNVVNHYLLGKQPFPFDLLYWNSDSTRMPATMHAFYLRHMYQRNDLVKPGGITLMDVPINLSRIQTPSYVLATKEDHIAPWTSTYLATQIYDGDVTFTLADSGHIAGVINPPVKKKYGYWTSNHLPPKADDWLAETDEKPGSWWPHWHQWQAKRAGKMVAARKVGSAKYKPIEKAPGRYAKVRDN